MLNVIYVAQFHETCGYSHAAMGYLKSLDYNLKDINLKVLSVSLEPEKIKNNINKNKLESESINLVDKYHFKDQQELNNFLDKDYICIWHMTSVFPVIQKRPNLGTFYRDLKCDLEQIIVGSVKNYHILAWETDTLCDEYKEIIKNYKTQTVIAPSQWNKNCFEKSFNSECIPHLISKKERKTEKVNLPDFSNKFVILSVSEWTNRKNFKCLIQSFLLEFSDSDQAMLILKTTLPPGLSKNDFLQQFSQIKKSVRTYKNKKQNIVVILDYLNKSKMNYLYEISDAFCLTSLGEGFSLPTSEAAAIGKPIISPRYGGHIDYLEPKNKYFIDGIWETVFDNPPYENNALWFQPTVSSTRKKMRAAFEDWKNNSLKVEGIKNFDIIRKGPFSKKIISQKIHNVIAGGEQENSKINHLKRKIQNKSLEQKMNILQNQFSNDHCYILNCGPSLNEHNEEKLKKFLKDKLTFTVKQSYEKYGDVSDFHFFNCSNLPKPSTPFEPHYKNKKDTILISSSNYEQYQRWSLMQTSDIFFKIPIRTEIHNEFLVRTGEIDKFLNKNNLTRPCGPGIMYETVLFTALHLGVKNITVLGWDLTMDTVSEKNYQHFYGNSSGLINRGDILHWEIEETRNFSENFYNWCNSNNINLSLVSNQSSLYEKIPRINLKL